MTDSERVQYENLLRKLHTPGGVINHDEYRTMMQSTMLYVMSELGEIRENITEIVGDISAIKERTPTKDELASVKRAVVVEGHWAWLGKGVAQSVKVVLTSIALITGVSAVYWAVKTHIGGAEK